MSLCPAPTPGTIQYSFQSSPFGSALLATTQKGLCFLGFVDNRRIALQELATLFPHAPLLEGFDSAQQQALTHFESNQKNPPLPVLDLNGTPFQHKVWQALLSIPFGKRTAYKTIAEQIGHPHACRAVGTAVGQNPIAFLVPCHRVIQASGALGNYRWGTERKSAILHWEATRAVHP